MKVYRAIEILMVVKKELRRNDEKAACEALDVCINNQIKVDDGMFHKTLGDNLRIEYETREKIWKLITTGSIK